MTAPDRDPGPQAADLIRRLRAWPVSSWQHGNRVDLTRAALQELAAGASAADGRARPQVPDAGVHALADQIQVLCGDATAAGVDRVQVAALLARLGRQLGLPAR